MFFRVKVLSFVILASGLIGCEQVEAPPKKTVIEAPQESSASVFMKLALSGDKKQIWKLSSEDFIDPTLAEIEKTQAMNTFVADWPKSLPGDISDLPKITRNTPVIEEIGSKEEPEYTVHAFTATYGDTSGYEYSDTNVAKVIKFLVTVNPKSGLIRTVEFDKVLEKNEKLSASKRSKTAFALYDKYSADKIKNRSIIRSIFKLYPPSNVPIPELQTEVLRVQDLINAKKFSEVISVIESGGYSDEGRKISMGEGYGTKVVDYVKAKNFTNLPIKVTFDFDLEFYDSYTYKSGENFLGQAKYKTDITRYFEKEGVSTSLRLHPLETDTGNAYFDKLKYYSGYRVTQQRSDGTYSYSWDDTKNYSVKNLAIKNVEIWTE